MWVMLMDTSCSSTLCAVLCGDHLSNQYLITHHYSAKQTFTSGTASINTIIGYALLKCSYTSKHSLNLHRSYFANFTSIILK